IATVRDMWIVAAVFAHRSALCHIKRLVHMQFSLFAVFADSAVVVNPVSDVGVLLDLCHQNALADGMDGPRLDKENVAFLYRYLVEYFQKSVFLNALCKLFPADLPFKSMVQEGSLIGIHHIPHLCLAILSLMFQRIRVIRMHLDREIILRVNKLYKNRKILKTGAVRPEHFPAVFFNVLSQRFARIATVCNIGRSVRMAG